MKKKYPYLLLTLIMIGLLLILFIKKNLYPFGDGVLIYGDMHDQITAFYYQLYDSIKSNSSLLINFTTSGGINFFGILSYYILSPFSLIVLLFKRDEIFLCISIIIALKCIAASLTSFYALSKLFKDKQNNLLFIILSITYAFSGYFLVMYQITPWMDAMYLFPLVVVGLKKVLDLDKPYMYIIFMSLSIITSFYVSIMSIIFIFFISIFYIINYVEKENYKKSILSLGITTVISILSSLFIIIPSYIQISSSSRLYIKLTSIFNSRLGPITDKISFFITSSFIFVSIIILLFNIKKHKKFAKFIIPSIILLLIPYIIEPVNKMLHFGSYAMFPCRFGYILFFMFNVLSAYVFINCDIKNFGYNKLIRRIISIVICISSSILIYIVYSLKHEAINTQLYKLTLSGNTKVVMFMFLQTFIIFIAMLLITVLIDKKDKFYYPLILYLTIILIIPFTLEFIGNDKNNKILKNVYDNMTGVYHLDLDRKYRIKSNTSSIITNNGIVMDIPNIDHFTSLVDSNNLITLKKLGYKSYWTKNFSMGGTIFTDILLGNKYMLTLRTESEDYYNKIYNDFLKVYEYKDDISFGYFTENISLKNQKPGLDTHNKLYRAITGNKDNIIELYNYKDFDYINVECDKKKKLYFNIIDNDVYNYIEKNLYVKGRKQVYLNISNSLYHSEDVHSYKSIDIYVNDKLLKSNFPHMDENGTVNIGIYEDEEVDIKVKLNRNTEFSIFELGVLDLNKLDNFVKEEKVENDFKYDRNKIKINVNSEKSGLYFIPVNYIDGYKVKVNGKNKEVVKVYDNYLGVYLDSGKNYIEFSYIPKGLVISSIISIITIIGTILLFRFKLYDKIISCNWLSKLASYMYIGIYILALLFIYLIPIVCFVLSYFVYIS